MSVSPLETVLFCSPFCSVMVFFFPFPRCIAVFVCYWTTFIGGHWRLFVAGSFLSGGIISHGLYLFARVYCVNKSINRSTGYGAFKISLSNSIASRNTTPTTFDPATPQVHHPGHTKPQSQPSDSKPAIAATPHATPALAPQQPTQGYFSTWPQPSSYPVQSSAAGRRHPHAGSSRERYQRHEDPAS